MVRIAEPLEVHDLPLAQESDGVGDIRIVAEAEDVVVGNAGLLLCCGFVRTTLRQDSVRLQGVGRGRLGEMSLGQLVQTVLIFRVSVGDEQDVNEVQLRNP